MKIQLTVPLSVRTKNARKLQLLPVPMKNGFLIERRRLDLSGPRHALRRSRTQ